jgi:hypothetical protein
MVTVTVKELQDKYKPTSLDNIDFSSSDDETLPPSITMEKLRIVATLDGKVAPYYDIYMDTTKTPTNPSDYENEDVAGLGRNCRNFERSRWEAYRLKETRDWSYEGVLEICKRHAADLPLCEITATARKMFSWINLNHKEGMRGHKQVSKSHWADLRWTYYRRDVGETLSDFAFRVHISYAMAKKYSREKKLYRHDGRWFFVSDSVLEPVQTQNHSPHYDIYMDTMKTPTNPSEDDCSHKFDNLQTNDVRELERPPPILKEESFWPKLPDFILAELEKYEARKKQHV